MPVENFSGGLPQPRMAPSWKADHEMLKRNPAREPGFGNAKEARMDVPWS